LKRLRTPLVKRDGSLVEASWEEAIALAGKGLKQIRERSGGDKLAVLSSPQLTNEENYLVQKLARVVMGTNNIGSLATTGVNHSLIERLGSDASTCSYDDILGSDLVLVFGCDVTEEYPVVALKVREAVDRGSQLITLNPHPTRIDSLARIALKANRRTSVDLLQLMVGYIIAYDLVDHDFISTRTKGFQSFASAIRKRSLEEIADVPWVKPSRIIEAIHLYLRAKRPVIIVDDKEVTSAELALLCDLALITGNIGRDSGGIIVLRTPGNAQGLIDMGVGPDYLPGQLSVTDVAARQRFEAAWGKSLPATKGRDSTGIAQGVERGEIHGILVFGSDAPGEMKNAIFELPIFSVLVDTVYPKEPPYPDVVLPGANFAESDGTYTNCERRIQRLHSAISPPAGKQNWEIISALATSLGYPMHYTTVSSIYQEIVGLVSFYGVTEDKKITFADGNFSFGDNRTRPELYNLQNSEFLAALDSLS
jgi:predicted molibdopterin-dependent oxidoreductase YjgC